MAISSLFLLWQAISGITATNVAPDIVGIWQQNDRQLRFNTNGTFASCTVLKPFVLSNNGNTLVIGGVSTYQRMSGTDTSSIVGHWRDDSDTGEDILYLENGWSLSYVGKDPIGYFGTYEVQGSAKTDCDYQGFYTYSVGTVEVNAHSGSDFAFNVTIVPQTSLTLDGQVYQWISPPHQ